MSLCKLYYGSNALGKQSRCWAILPEGPGPFSVLYLLHGRGDDETVWARRTSLERYADRWPSLMIVMPDGDRSFYCDAVNGAKYQTAIIKDLIPHIDRLFHTRAEKSGRAIGGLSMGGYGAIKLALQYPDLFVSAHSHSGALDFGHGWEAESPDTIRILGDKGAGGGPNDLYRLVAESANLPAMWIDCGTDDFILDHSRHFHAHLKKLGVAHEYHEYALGHSWDYWDLHIQEAVAFHLRHLK